MRFLLLLLTLFIVGCGPSESKKLTRCIDNADSIPGNWDWEMDEPTQAYWDEVTRCRNKYPNGSY